MHPHWAASVEGMLELIGGTPAQQQRILSGELPDIRTALKGSRFETMGERELAAIVATAQVSLRRRNAAS